MDPRQSGSAYGKSRGVEPAKTTGPVGPMARGAAHKDRAHTASGGKSNIAVGAMKPSAKAK